MTLTAAHALEGEIPAGHDAESWAAWNAYRASRGPGVFYWDFLEDNPALYDGIAEDPGAPAAVAIATAR